ncbi:MAG TPA: glycosyltransferase, partial [bacterium]|nr:glycosyltransferase [bacterium]
MTVAVAVRSNPLMRMAMFSESYLPRISGVVHSVTSFVTALRAQGHQVTIVAPQVSGYRDPDPDIVRFPSVRTRQADFPIGIPYAPVVWQQLLTMDLDLVHTHGPFTMGAAAARLARRRDLPLVFTHHTLYDEYVHYAPGPAWVLRALVRAYTVRYANRCDCVIAPSRALETRLRAQGVRGRIEVLSTAALDPELISSLDPSWVRPAFNLPPARPVMVTASRLAREKSVDLVLRAFARVVRTNDAVLLVVGGGPEEAALHRLADDLHLGARVVFAGMQSHRRTLECLAAADVFVFGSQTETQGLVVVEAMAAGTPVVAVNAGGIADAVHDGDTGVLVPPAPDALADSVVHLLDNTPLRQRLAARGREAASEYLVPALTPRLVE